MGASTLYVDLSERLLHLAVAKIYAEVDQVEGHPGISLSQQ